MNVPASKFSSGCESGWTVYLEQSYNNVENIHNDDDDNHDFGLVEEKQDYDCYEDEEEEEEEDLSMVSDASSGPPHCHEDDRDQEFFSQNIASSDRSNWAIKKSPYNIYTNNNNNNSNNNMKKKKKNRVVKEKHLSCLDDTASSSHKNKSNLSRKEEAFMEYSHGFSATNHFKGESRLDKYYGAFRSSFGQGSPSQESGQFQGGNNWK